MLRFLLAEAAQVSVRSIPEWRNKYVHLAMRRGNKIAKVAMARRLAVRLYSMRRNKWERALEVCCQILYSPTFAQRRGSMRIILFLVAFIVGVRSSLAAEPPTPYEVIRFPSGKLTLGGELFKPKGEGPFPAVLYNHGSAEGMLSDAASTAMGPLYAAKGWVYFMPYRRGQGLSAKAGPYIGDQIAAAEKSGGHDAAVKTMIDLLRGDHLSDQLAALAWLKQQNFVQSNRIAVAGQSFGGIETILGAASYSFCAAVDASGGAMSWKEAPALQEVMKENARSSKSPTLFFQAENDYTLEPSQVLYKKMLASGKAAEIKIYPPYGKTNFDGHSFTWLGSSIWFNDVFGFIQKHCAVTASK